MEVVTRARRECSQEKRGPDELAGEASRSRPNTRRRRRSLSARCRLAHSRLSKGHIRHSEPSNTSRTANGKVALPNQR